MPRLSLRHIAVAQRAQRSALGSIRWSNATTADRPQAPKPIKDSTSALECELRRVRSGAERLGRLTAG